MIMLVLSGVFCSLSIICLIWFAVQLPNAIQVVLEEEIENEEKNKKEKAGSEKRENGIE